MACLSYRYREEGEQIYCGTHSIFSPLAITFKEGPRGIFDFFMSSMLSACCWKKELEAVDGLHKRANAS